MKFSSHLLKTSQRSKYLKEAAANQITLNKQPNFSQPTTKQALLNDVINNVSQKHPKNLESWVEKCLEKETRDDKYNSLSLLARNTSRLFGTKILTCGFTQALVAGYIVYKGAKAFERAGNFNIAAFRAAIGNLNSSQLEDSAKRDILHHLNNDYLRDIHFDESTEEVTFSGDYRSCTMTLAEQREAAVNETRQSIVSGSEFVKASSPAAAAQPEETILAVSAESGSNQTELYFKPDFFRGFDNPEQVTTKLVELNNNNRLVDGKISDQALTIALIRVIDAAGPRDFAAALKDFKLGTTTISLQCKILTYILGYVHWENIPETFIGKVTAKITELQQIMNADSPEKDTIAELIFRSFTRDAAPSAPSKKTQKQVQSQELIAELTSLYDSGYLNETQLRDFVTHGKSDTNVQALNDINSKCLAKVSQLRADLQKHRTPAIFRGFSKAQTQSIQYVDYAMLQKIKDNSKRKQAEIEASYKEVAAYYPVLLPTGGGSNFFTTPSSNAPVVEPAMGIVPDENQVRLAEDATSNMQPNGAQSANTTPQAGKSGMDALSPQEKLMYFLLQIRKTVKDNAWEEFINKYKYSLECCLNKSYDDSLRSMLDLLFKDNQPAAKKSGNDKSDPALAELYRTIPYLPVNGLSAYEDTFKKLLPPYHFTKDHNGVITVKSNLSNISVSITLRDKNADFKPDLLIGAEIVQEVKVNGALKVYCGEPSLLALQYDNNKSEFQVPPELDIGRFLEIVFDKHEEISGQEGFTVECLSEEEKFKYCVNNLDCDDSEGNINFVDETGNKTKKNVKGAISYKVVNAAIQEIHAEEKQKLNDYLNQVLKASKLKQEYSKVCNISIIKQDINLFCAELYAGRDYTKLADFFEVLMLIFIPPGKNEMANTAEASLESLAIDAGTKALAKLFPILDLNSLYDSFLSNGDKEVWTPSHISSKLANRNDQDCGNDLYKNLMTLTMRIPPNFKSALKFKGLETPKPRAKGEIHEIKHSIGDISLGFGFDYTDNNKVTRVYIDCTQNNPAAVSGYNVSNKKNILEAEPKYDLKELNQVGTFKKSIKNNIISFEYDLETQEIKNPKRDILLEGLDPSRVLGKMREQNEVLRNGVLPDQYLTLYKAADGNEYFQERCKLHFKDSGEKLFSGLLGRFKRLGVVALGNFVSLRKEITQMCDGDLNNANLEDLFTYGLESIKNNEEYGAPLYEKLKNLDPLLLVKAFIYNRFIKDNKKNNPTMVELLQYAAKHKIQACLLAGSFTDCDEMVKNNKLEFIENFIAFMSGSTTSDTLSTNSVNAILDIYDEKDKVYIFPSTIKLNSNDRYGPEDLSSLKNDGFEKYVVAGDHNLDGNNDLMEALRGGLEGGEEKQNAAWSLLQTQLQCDWNMKSDEDKILEVQKFVSNERRERCKDGNDTLDAIINFEKNYSSSVSEASMMGVVSIETFSDLSETDSYKHSGGDLVEPKMDSMQALMCKVIEGEKAGKVEYIKQYLEEYKPVARICYKSVHKGHHPEPMQNELADIPRQKRVYNLFKDCFNLGKTPDELNEGDIIYVPQAGFFSFRCSSKEHTEQMKAGRVENNMWGFAYPRLGAGILYGLDYTRDEEWKQLWDCDHKAYGVVHDIKLKNMLYNSTIAKLSMIDMREFEHTIYLDSKDCDEFTHQKELLKTNPKLKVNSFFADLKGTGSHIERCRRQQRLEILSTMLNIFGVKIITGEGNTKTVSANDEGRLEVAAYIKPASAALQTIVQALNRCNKLTDIASLTTNVLNPLDVSIFDFIEKNILPIINNTMPDENARTTVLAESHRKASADEARENDEAPEQESAAELLIPQTIVNDGNAGNGYTNSCGAISVYDASLEQLGGAKSTMDRRSFAREFKDDSYKKSQKIIKFVGEIDEIDEIIKNKCCFPENITGYVMDDYYSRLIKCRQNAELTNILTRMKIRYNIDNDNRVTISQELTVDQLVELCKMSFLHNDISDQSLLTLYKQQSAFIKFPTLLNTVYGEYVNKSVVNLLRNKISTINQNIKEKTALIEMFNKNHSQDAEKLTEYYKNHISKFESEQSFKKYTALLNRLEGGVNMQQQRLTDEEYFIIYKSLDSCFLPAAIYDIQDVGDDSQISEKKKLFNQEYKTQELSNAQIGIGLAKYGYVFNGLHAYKDKVSKITYKHVETDTLLELINTPGHWEAVKVQQNQDAAAGEPLQRNTQFPYNLPTLDNIKDHFSILRTIKVDDLTKDLARIPENLKISVILNKSTDRLNFPEAGAVKSEAELITYLQINNTKLFNSDNNRWMEFVKIVIVQNIQKVLTGIFQTANDENPIQLKTDSLWNLIIDCDQNKLTYRNVKTQTFKDGEDGDVTYVYNDVGDLEVSLVAVNYFSPNDNLGKITNNWAVKAVDVRQGVVS